jgi:DUF4097 and DUF4098 domain-containing protein YvlB
MKSNKKMIWKIVIITIVAGLILAIIGFTLGASRSLYIDRTGVHISGNEITHIAEHDFTPFRNINIDSGYINVELVSSNAYGIEINSDNAGWSWSLENDTLTVSLIRSPRVQIMNFNFLPIEQNYIKVFIPTDTMLDIVSVKTSSGSIEIGDIRALSVQVNSATGNIRLSNLLSTYLQAATTSGNITGSIINAENFIYNTRTGDGRLQTINAEMFSAHSTSGDLTITGSNFTAVNVTARTGTITGNGIRSLSTSVQTTSGNIRLSGDFSGETEIQARTGDIRISTSRERDDYSFAISSRVGTIRFDGERFTNEIMSSPTQENHIKITTTSGDIDVNFGS